MPRRRMSGAAFAFLVAFVSAHVAGATDERIVRDQDLSDLSREEQIAYLILKDQLTDLRRRDSVIRGEWRPMVCVRVGADSMTAVSVDPSAALLGALREGESIRSLAFELVPASVCRLDARQDPLSHAPYSDNQIEGAVLIDTNALSPDRTATVHGFGCDSGRYWGGWYTVGFVRGGICGGFCGIDWSYDVYELNGSVSLAKSICYASN